MAPRARTVMSSDDFDRSFPESSPDPLAGSINENKAKMKRKATRAPKQPLVSSSPSKQNRRVSISEPDFSSPSKSMVLNTPRGGGASPWRIKVTVEAEPGSEDENLQSPTVKRVTRTKTTTVPLKDPDAPSPVKRRGRPRKSDIGVAKPKRSGTSVKRKTKSKTRDTSLEVDASVADIDTDTAPKKRRGRPRKSIQPPEEEPTLVVGEPDSEDASVFDAAPAVQRGKKPEVEVEDGILTPVPSAKQVPPVLDTTSAALQEPQSSSAKDELLDEIPLPQSNERKEPETLEGFENPMKFTPSETKFSRKIRARKGTPAAKGKVLVEISSDEESEEEDISTPSGTDEEALETQQNQFPEPAADSEEFEPIQAAIAEDDEDEGFQDVTNFPFEEGATRMPDDTTVLESENFSMISVDSLPSSGGLTSPVYGPTERTPTSLNAATRPENSYLKRALTQPHHVRSSPRTAFRSSPVPARKIQPPAQMKSSPPAAPLRHKTPTIEENAPSEPPPIEPTRSSPSEAKTPKIGRVVKAGVALQGVLDPNRVTPDAGPSKTADERGDELDDLFRGFSERTRRELQAGLRLGEQLAQQNQLSAQSSPALSSPIKAKMPTGSADDVFSSKIKQRKSRLPTPEDQDDHKIPSPLTTQEADVQYPSLSVSDQESHLISPARSEDEMSWRVDTPPVRPAMESSRFVTVSHERGEVIRGKDTPVVADKDEREQQEDYSDIWQEEASRSSESPDAEAADGEGLPQLLDLLNPEGPIKPARRKLPRTWRRKSSGDFHYSDEAEESPQQTPSSTESDEPPRQEMDKGKERMVEAAIAEELFDDEDDMSEASDDTGMFFQSNLPNIFNKKRSTELRQKKAEKRNLSLLMNEGESLLPESSPPIPAAKTPAVDKANPFLNTPPRFSVVRSSPVKSSPLRQEIRASDTSSESVVQGFEESTLPLPASSPFHTQVDGETVLSKASDERQFLEEIAAATDSSLRRIQNEADDYLDAYEPQERTMHDITEMTEPSRTWNKDTTMMPSSPPAVKPTFEESMLKPKRTYAPLFVNESASSESASSKLPKTSESKDMPAPVIAVAPRTEEVKRPSSGIFSRLTTSLWGALGTPPAPPPHPILAKFDRLPKVEPWTKTHYKALDKLYQSHKKQPTLFSPCHSSSTSNTNDALLADFLRKAKRPFLDAVYSAWGYSVVMDEGLCVLAAVYMQLLTLRDVGEYEEKSGKEIQMGDCGPGVSGEIITAEEVMRRLSSVIMGEQLRRDEKRGKVIDRTQSLSVVWPA